ncbi:MAG: zinc dependent phospholipase C family protein [Bacillaceae bacterium]|nr:zinc dependent phospholipase C family protein [Bacillaceae bacterium]
MPNSWTHILFSEEIMDAMDNKREYLDAYNHLKLGAQGPDPFFYHNFWPWKKDDRVNEIGSRIHTECCGPFLMDLIEAGKEKSTETKAFILGFVTHHILDRHTHPYIHYRAGYEANKHQELEVIIDTLMMDRFRNFQTWKVPVYKEIDIGRNITKEIEQLLHHTIQTYFPENIEQISKNFIQESYRDMKLALKILFDPYRWKNTLLSSLISSFSHQPLKHNLDYLNEDRKTWHHPATNEPKTESFLDLYERAKAEGLTIISAIIDYWHDPETRRIHSIESMIGNISYDTGEPLEKNLKNVYSSPIV